MEAVLLVAGAGTIAVLTDCLITTIGSFMLICSIVSCVAPGTIRLKRWELPGNEFRVALMALSALKVTAVVLRLVWQRDMAIVRWCPRVRDVAGIALL